MDFNWSDFIILTMNPIVKDNKILKIQKTIFTVSTNVNVGTVTSIPIVLYEGKSIPSGTSLVIKSGSTIVEVTTSAIIETRATSISITSKSIKFPIFQRACIEVKDTILLDSSLKQYAYAHQSLYLTTGTNGNDYLSAFGTSAFSVNSGTTLSDGDSKPNRWAAQFSFFVAPTICRVDEIVGWASTDASHAGDNATIKLWTATPNGGTTTNLTIDLIYSISLANVNNQNHLFDLEATPTNNIDLAKGDILFVSIQRTGSLHGSVKWYADLGVKIKTMD